MLQMDFERRQTSLLQTEREIQELAATMPAQDSGLPWRQTVSYATMLRRRRSDARSSATRALRDIADDTV